MKIRLLKAYSMFPPQEIVDFDKPIADLLILRKIAEPLEEKKKTQKPKIEKTIETKIVNL